MNFRVKTALRCATAIILFGSFATGQKDAPQQESASDVPDAITIPEGLQPVLFVRAVVPRSTPVRLTLKASTVGH